MNRKLRLVPAAVLAILVASAPPSGAESAPVAIDIKPKATLLDGGTAVLLRGKAVCPSGWEVLEEFAYVVQDGNESFFGFVTTPCDGKWHRFEVRVLAFEEFRFHEGEAVATGFILVQLPGTPESMSAGDSQRITIHG